jgi:hypothetical protein
MTTFTMVSQNTRRSRSSVYFPSTSMPETSSRQGEVLVTDTTYHTGEDQCLRYDEIYRIFNTGDFSPEDKDLEVYQNIQKSDIHLVASRRPCFLTTKQPNGALSSLTQTLLPL